ncbi:MAG: L-histidine N(alpha)-methyltransferase [Okeania sp. SIO3C4]|nr:L-histidine N(alpha)-methyltransferase [Okeania sp. SIO3C4]
MGSTIGNLLPLECDKFLHEVASCLKSGDLMLIGFDLIKSPQTIIDAYTLGPNEAFYKKIS